MFHQSYPEHIRANFLFYTWIFKYLPLNIWITKVTVNTITQNGYFIKNIFIDDNIFSISINVIEKTLLELNVIANKNIIYFNLFQLHTRHPHFFHQFVPWLNKYQIQNHLSGTKLHLACLQIQNLFLHFTKARYVMFPENYCTTRHLLNIVWKKL